MINSKEDCDRLIDLIRVARVLTGPWGSGPNSAANSFGYSISSISINITMKGGKDAFVANQNPSSRWVREVNPSDWRFVDITWNAPFHVYEADMVTRRHYTVDRTTNEWIFDRWDQMTGTYIQASRVFQHHEFDESYYSLTPEQYWQYVVEVS